MWPIKIVPTVEGLWVSQAIARGIPQKGHLSRIQSPEMGILQCSVGVV